MLVAFSEVYFDYFLTAEGSASEEDSFPKALLSAGPESYKEVSLGEGHPDMSSAMPIEASPSNVILLRQA